MNFKKGDRVKHKHDKTEGTIVDVLNTLFVEVSVGDDNYFWHQANIELINEYDDWDPDFGYYGEDFFPFIEDNKKEDKCVCDSWELFHFGCRCGYIEREKERKDALQRKRRGSDLDREDEV